ncbi:hypothetical protein BD779DRAFT_1491667, partial [Infundibulicybe gibba]
MTRDILNDDLVTSRWSLTSLTFISTHYLLSSYSTPYLPYTMNIFRSLIGKVTWQDPNAAEVVKISSGQLYLVRPGNIRTSRECMCVGAPHPTTGAVTFIP